MVFSWLGNHLIELLGYLKTGRSAGRWWPRVLMVVARRSCVMVLDVAHLVLIVIMWFMVMIIR